METDNESIFERAALASAGHFDGRKRIEELEAQVVGLTRCVDTLTHLLGLTVEGVARTGAYDEAGTQAPVGEALENLHQVANEAGIEARAVLESAASRVENKIHIKRLCR